MMKEAIETYEGKPEEHQLVLMNAQLRLQRGDADGAIRILEAVKPGKAEKHLKICIYFHKSYPKT